MGIKQTRNISMTDKHVSISGPASGNGKEIAVQLAALGAELILACCDAQRGEQTADEIARHTGTKNCEDMHINTSNPQSIHEVA